VFLFSHLTYLVQLVYIGKMLGPKYHEFSLKLLIFLMPHYDIKCKTVTILFYLVVILIMVYKITTRFIADDKVVYQQVGCSWLKTTAEHDVV